jgi:hypothetical protein
VHLVAQPASRRQHPPPPHTPYWERACVLHGRARCGRAPARGRCRGTPASCCRSSPCRPRRRRAAPRPVVEGRARGAARSSDAAAQTTLKSSGRYSAADMT